MAVANGEVKEEWNGECGVYTQGNSRVVTVPSDVDCSVGDGVQALIGKKNGRAVYLVMLMSSLGNQKEIAARTGAIEQSEAETDTHCGCGGVRRHDPSKIVTIPSQCEEGLFGNETSQMVFVGRIDESLAYLKYVPANNMRFKFDGAAV
jgi:hypothetical protein